MAFLQSVLPKLLVVNSEGGDQQKKNAPSSSDAAAHQFAIDDMKDGEFGGMKVDFDKILQSLVATMEHPDPFVRKVAMYWMSRIVKSHMREKITATTNSGENSATTGATRGSKSKNTLAPTRQGGKRTQFTKSDESKQEQKDDQQTYLSAASISVRHSLPHVLPGILLRYVECFCPSSLFVTFVTRDLCHYISMVTHPLSLTFVLYILVESFILSILD